MVTRVWFFAALLVLGTLGTVGTQPLEPLEPFGTPGTAPQSAPTPARYVVRLETTKGAIVIACVRAWAPLGADRFYELVISGYFDNSAIFRVRPKTFAQFGINGDPKLSQAWRGRTIADDPFQ